MPLHLLFLEIRAFSASAENVITVNVIYLYIDLQDFCSYQLSSDLQNKRFFKFGEFITLKDTS